MILIIGGSYQGKTQYARDNFPDSKYFNQLHLFVKKRLDEGNDLESILQEIKDSTSQGNWVIISDEIGNGVVPLEAEDRRFREVTGSILISLAKEATEVHRVTCGIGQKIK